MIFLLTPQLRQKSENFLDRLGDFVFMRIEKDEEGNYWLVIESKEDLEEFKKMILEAFRKLEEEKKKKRKKDNNPIENK